MNRSGLPDAGELIFQSVDLDYLESGKPMKWNGDAHRLERAKFEDHSDGDPVVVTLSGPLVVVPSAFPANCLRFGALSRPVTPVTGTDVTGYSAGYSVPNSWPTAYGNNLPLVAPDSKNEWYGKFTAWELCDEDGDIEIIPVGGASFSGGTLEIWPLYVLPSIASIARRYARPVMP